MKQFALIGSVLAFFGVAFGAFGAHALRDRIAPDMLAIFQTGVQYQMIHALALVALGLAAPDVKWARGAGWLFVAGVVVFSGSLYALSLSGVRVLGAITPLGGVCFLTGWAVLAFGLSRSERPSS